MHLTDKIVELYQKPNIICAPPSLLDTQNMTINSFAEVHKARIEREVAAQGFHLRKATIDDITNLSNFVLSRYPIEIATEVSAYDMYRFITYGYGLLIENEAKEIQACHFEIGYDTPDKTSYSIRLGVDRALVGKHLGRMLILYTCLLAMERGSFVKRGLLDYDNHVILYIHLNKIGSMLYNFRDIQSIGICYNACLPLSPNGLSSNKIDVEKVLDFTKNNKKGVDFMTVDCNDLETLHNMYEKTSFKAVAFLRAGTYQATNHLFALPAEIIDYQAASH